jgi:hypothetical protein
VPVAGNFWLNIDFPQRGKKRPGGFFRCGFALGSNCRGREIFAGRGGKYFHFSSNGGCEKARKTGQNDASPRHTTR